MSQYFVISEIGINDNLDMESGGTNHDILGVGDLEVTGRLDVEGSKNCVQITQNYGKRRISAYETAEYYFGDIGEGVIKEGECIINIEPIFLECVNTDIPYQVFLQVYKGCVQSIERNRDNFIVKGTNDTEFSWEIKAKRRGFENVRLELSEYNK